MKNGATATIGIRAALVPQIEALAEAAGISRVDVASVVLAAFFNVPILSGITAAKLQEIYNFSIKSNNKPARVEAVAHLPSAGTFSEGLPAQPSQPSPRLTRDHLTRDETLLIAFADLAGPDALAILLSHARELAAAKIANENAAETRRESSGDSI